MKKFRKPYRIKRKKSIIRNRFFWLFILVLIIFGGIFYLICFHSFFQIKEIKISGNQKVSIDEASLHLPPRSTSWGSLTEDLENLLREKVNQKILFFNSKSIFLANFSEIKKEILKNFPQVEETNLKRKFPNIIFVQIKERKPVAVFNQTDKNFFIDKEGIIFERISEVDLKMLKIKNLILTADLELGEKAIEKEKLFQILEIESKLREDLKILSQEISIVSEERLNIKTSEGWQIYFSFKENLDWQLTKLRAVLEEKILQERRKDLEYIDVRFGNFAPYKFK